MFRKPHPIWRARSGLPMSSEIGALASALKIPLLIARVLISRGLGTVEAGRDFLDSRLASLPDPRTMLDMSKAVDRVATALCSGEPLAVHGDYDVDGIAGTALLVEVLRALGGEVNYHIPQRLRDGYGLSGAAIRRAAEEGARVLISTDCGISASKEADLAATLGIDLIITDHHQPPDLLPQAFALLNPHRSGCPFEFKELAGVGVAFFFLVGLRQELRKRGYFNARPEPDLRQRLDLVALGTIADVVPLVGVNRALTRAGLQFLNHGCRPGLNALKAVAGIKEVSCGTVGFGLAPRINAAGRLEDAMAGVSLLLESDPDRALVLAGELDALNRQRRQIEQETLAQAISRFEQDFRPGQRTIVLADDRWHPGVIGIVASRLVEHAHRPTVLIALEDEHGKGSARSIPGFHLYQALETCRGSLAGFGGHEYAAGLTIDPSAIEDFAGHFERVAQERMQETDLLPRLSHDGEVVLEELSLDIVEGLAQLAPFGAGNPEPSFVVANARVQQIKPVGDAHLRFTVRQGGYSLPCIAFAMAERLHEFQGEVDLLVVPTVNVWQGRRSVQLRVRDVRPGGTS